MTHEYVIAVGGRIEGAVDSDARQATAIAWAADRVLAVGSDERIRAISRGDSTFIDLAGCDVTAPDRTTSLEPGAPADLDFWRRGSDAGDTVRRIAIVRGGTFTEGDPLLGPFARAARQGT